MRVNRSASLFAFACVCALSAACGTAEETVPDAESDSGPDTGADAGSDALNDTSSDAGSGTGADGGGDVGSDVASACTTPNPVGCPVLGCDAGFECVPSGAEGCAPSTCSCDEATGSWECTADCGPMMECRPTGPTLCPTEAPAPGSACADPELSCTWGEECCCGSCSPSFGCDCEGGAWSCYATDACMIESCEGRECSTNSDCEGGAEATECVDGVCTRNTEPQPCILYTDAPGCAAAGCAWESPGCGTGAEYELPQAGCFPAVDCNAGGVCPADHGCVTVDVLPDCATDPENPCDACGQRVGLCLPIL